MFIAFSLGMVIGGISGFFGGKIDLVIMRFIEILIRNDVFHVPWVLF